MAIQHRAIPNTELHEPKGADSAIVGTVLKATGTGTTVFDLISVSQLKGSVSDIEGLMLGVGPGGTFKTVAKEYASFTSTITSDVVSTVKNMGTDTLFVSGGGFRVSEAGVYLITFHTPVISSEGSTALPTLRNVTTSTTVLTGGSGLVVLNNTDVYVSGQANSYSLVRIV